MDNKITDPKALEVGKTYKITETFEARFTGRNGDNMYFSEAKSNYPWATRDEMFDSAVEVVPVPAEWPPQVGDVWVNNVSGCPYFARNVSDGTSHRVTTFTGIVWGDALLIGNVNPTSWTLGFRVASS